MKSLHTITAILLCLIFMPFCSGEKAPRIVYNEREGNADIHFGNKTIPLEAIASVPKLLSFRHPKLGAFHLVEFSRGDSCPSQYLVLLQHGDFRNLGEVGNCNEVSVRLDIPYIIRLEFAGVNTQDPAFPKSRRKNFSVDITADGISGTK